HPTCTAQAARAGALGGGLLMSVPPDQGGTKLWMRDATTGDPLQVIVFVQRCAEVFGPLGFAMGARLLRTPCQCVQRRRTRARSRHAQACCMDPHKWLAGSCDPQRPESAR